jgi:copper chaperone CopZ
MTRSFATNLRCGSCVATIKPALDQEPGIQRWEADTTSPDKTLRIEGDISMTRLNQILEPLGYKALHEIEPALSPPLATEEPATSYFPLALILAYLLGIAGLVEYAQGSWSTERAMRHFMAGFFLVFSFFKLLNVTAFADAYMTYDVVAKRARWYGLAYPFIELLFGTAYLINFLPIVTNVATLVVMGVSTIGVVESLMKKRKIRCACLGTVFNLPMSVVTLVEDTLMVAMALAMLFMSPAGH